MSKLASVRMPGVAAMLKPNPRSTSPVSTGLMVEVLPSSRSRMRTRGFFAMNPAMTAGSGPAASPVVATIDTLPACGILSPRMRDSSRP
ncbi:hypothetical protein D3C87_1938930 [compost metagenome]